MTENQMAPEPEKKGLSGCMIAVIVGVGLLAAAVAAVAWFISRTPEGKQTVEFARASAQMMMRAAQAPGASELKKTLCKQAALVLDVDEFHRIQKMLQAPQGASRAHLQVNCDPGSGNPIPSCGDVARTWLAAVGHTDGDFEVAVKQGGKAHCAELYSATGERIGEGHPNP
jgi:hypothetical protein